MPEPKLAALAEEFAAAGTSEFANASKYIERLTEALGVTRPGFEGSGYQHEYKVRVVHRDGSESVNRIDLYKEGCFVLEAKKADVEKHLGTLEVLGVVKLDDATKRYRRLAGLAMAA